MKFSGIQNIVRPAAQPAHRLPIRHSLILKLNSRKSGQAFLSISVYFKYCCELARIKARMLVGPLGDWMHFARFISLNKGRGAFVQLTNRGRNITGALSQDAREWGRTVQGFQHYDDDDTLCTLLLSLHHSSSSHFLSGLKRLPDFEQS